MIEQRLLNALVLLLLLAAPHTLNAAAAGLPASEAWRGAVAARSTQPLRLKISGQWRDGYLQGQRVKPRNPDKDPDQVRVQGRIDRVQGSVGKHGAALTYRLDIAGIVLRSDVRSAVAAGISIADLQGETVEIDATYTLTGLVIRSIATLADDAGNDIEIIGTVSDQLLLEDGSYALQIAGISVRLPRSLYSNGQVRTQRQDDRRPAEQFSINVAGRPLTIGGEVGIDSSFERDFDLGQRRDDVVYGSSQELQLEAFYGLSSAWSLFAEAKLQHEVEWDRGDDQQETNTRLERGETWLLWDQINDSRFSLQIGRQNFAEPREWWWDEDLDALRVHYDAYPFHAEVALAQQVLPLSFDERGVDPQQKDILRTLGRATWQWDANHRLEAFALLQRDGSANPRLGSRLREADADEQDADLSWFGLRAIGGWQWADIDMNYWLDVAMVDGNETELDFSDNDDGTLTVRGAARRSIHGNAVDVGVSWAFPLAAEPTLTVSWARGSGDADGNAFRQTGLQDNNWKFNGVDRFRYYGEVSRPTLSNLAITTLGIGFALGTDSSLEILLHDYRRVHSAGSAPDWRVDGELEGDDERAGREVNLVLGLEAWTHWEFELTAGAFKPGEAFTSATRDMAARAVLKLNYNF